MFIVRVLKGEAFIRDEEMPTRREAVARVQALGKPGSRFMEAGRKVRVVTLPDGSATGKKA